MDSFSEKVLYNQVSDTIRSNIDSINQILSNCAINSKTANEEEKLLNFLSIDSNKLLVDGHKADYYDFDEVAKVFNMLESSKPDVKKRPKTTSRSESVSSLASTPGQSCEDVPHQLESLAVNEVTTYLSDIRGALQSITESSFNVLDINSLHHSETNKNTKFCDLVMSLQKLAKDLQSIASSDSNSVSDEYPAIDSQLINNLQQLNHVSLKRNY